jgi:hypothetical protein
MTDIFSTKIERSRVFSQIICDFLGIAVVSTVPVGLPPTESLL